MEQWRTKSRRFLALLLSAVMCMGMLNITAMASGEEPEDQEPPVCEEHQWGEWEAVLAPSCEEEGKAAVFCEVCGEQGETRAIDATGHEWEVDEEQEDGVLYRCVNCGAVRFADGEPEEEIVQPRRSAKMRTAAVEDGEDGIEPYADEGASNMAGAALLGKAVDGVITLDGDVTLTSKMSVNQDIVLDLNGHTVTATDSSYFNTIEVNSGKTLTIQDSSDTKAGKITDSGLTGSSFSADGVISSSGTLNLLGGTIEATKTNCVRVKGGTTTLDGAALVCNASMKSGVEIYQNAKAEATAEVKSGSITAASYGLNVGKNHNATVTGGTITVTATSAHGVQVGGNCEVSLKDCKIYATGNSSVGVYAGSKKVTLENVVIESKANAIFLNSECEVTISGENTHLKGTRVIVLNNGWSTGTTSSLTITGGKVESANCNPLKTIDLQAPSDASHVSKPEIEGGTFNTDVTPYVVKGKAQDAEGRVLPVDEVTVPIGSVAKVDGKGYTTLTEAFAAVATATDKTITLLKDVDYTKENTTGTTAKPDLSGVTIDLNGKTVTTGYVLGESSSAGDDPLLILLGDFTLKNGKVQAKGSYGIFTGNVAGAVDPNKVATIEDVEVLGGGINVGSKVELTNVTAVGNTYYAVWSEGDVTIKSGTYSSDGYAVLGVSNNHGSMTVEGGTFNAKENQNMVLGGYGKPLIKGGTFNKDMTNENVTLDEGLQWKDNNDTWTVEKKPVPVEKDVKIEGYAETLASYETLQEAIDNYSNFENVWMIVYDKPLTESVTIKNGQNVTISLDHTLTNEAGKDTITVENGGWLTLYFNNDNPEYVVELVNNSEGYAAVNNAGTVDFPYSARVKGEYALKNNGGTVRLLGRFEGQIETTKPADNAETNNIGNWYNVPVGAVMAGNGAMVNDPDENIIIKQSSDQWCITSEEGWYKCTQPYAEMNGQNYASIQDAVNAAGNTPAEIKVVYPYSSVSSVAITVAKGQDITLDLNGKTLSSKSNTKVDPTTEPVIKNDGTLTIKGKGTVKPGNTSGKFTANTVENTGTLTIEGGTYQAYTGYKSLNNDGGTITVKGGVFAEDISSIATPGEGLQFTADGKGVEEKLDETNAAAKIVNGEETTYYKTLQEAIAAGETASTVTLLVDTAESVVIAKGQNITLDLNGKTLANTEKQHTITNNGTLTITGTGTVDNVSHGKAAVYNDGTITLQGGTYTRSAENGHLDTETGTRVNGGNSWYVVRNNTGTMNIEDGATIQGTSGFSSMVSNGNNFGNAVLNIKGGKLESSSYVAIQNQIGCTLNISGGTVEGTGAPYCLSLYGTTNISGSAVVNGWVQVWSYDFYAANRADNNNPVHIRSELNISGGTLNDTQLQAVHGLSGYDPAVPVDQLNLSQAYALWGTGDTKSLINITGGTINMQNGLVTCRITNEGGPGRGIEKIANGGAAEIRVSGGSFLTAVPSEYCTEGYVPVQNGDRYTVTPEVHITGVTLNQATATLYTNGTNTVTLTATVAPADTTDDTTVTWTSSSTAVATVSNGVVTAVANGTATITATVGGHSATCTVTVTRRSTGGGGSSYRPSTRPSNGGTVNIDDPDVPLTERPFLFTDVTESDWYYEGVKYVFDKEMMNGITDTAFAPQSTTTRGMIATILYRLEGSPAVETPAPFTDVAEGRYYTDAVAWASANGIVKGYDGNVFKPDTPITREQMAAILHRYAAFKGYDVTGSAELNGFADAASVSTYAVEPMGWARAAELISGVDGKLLPQGDATRAQIAAILMRFCENVAK